ncbi:hypothetical protein PoB_004445500 [Plakobranchus ocellatus]|uniref:Uncharacterized protein n=1 Tax=Plakobranchus ocellatus TaxID=259542 RepID=A0AAV4BBE7_9GAST|nr:hypothetical protein PoB_004445500 [Plakobranchus ocellatus]
MEPAPVHLTSASPRMVATEQLPGNVFALLKTFYISPALKWSPHDKEGGDIHTFLAFPFPHITPLAVPLPHPDTLSPGPPISSSAVATPCGHFRRAFGTLTISLATIVGISHLCT